MAIGHLLHYRYGLSFARSAAVLSEMFGLNVSRAALCPAATSSAVELVARHAAIRSAVNTAPAVTCDETGWRIGGRRRWLWVAATSRATLFRVCQGRSFDDAVTLLDAGYPGVLVRDGWAPYRAYVQATHQSCVAHLARRVRELKAELPTHEHGFLTQVGGILTEALVWRDDERPAVQRGEAAVELRDRLDVVCAGTILGETNQQFRLPSPTRGRRHLHVPHRRLRRRQLARRTSHPPGRREPQNARRQPDRERRRHPVDHHQRARHRPPTRPRRTRHARPPRPSTRTHTRFHHSLKTSQPGASTPIVARHDK